MAIREVTIEGVPHQNVNFPDHPLAHELLDGLKGVELGASSHNSFHLEGSVNVAPSDDEAFYIQYHVPMNGKYCLVDHYGEANALPFADSTQDYVISSHVLEHVPNLVGAFHEAARVLKDGGILFMIVPRRDARPEDAERPISTIAEFARAYNEKWTSETIPPEVALPAGGARGHIWVFTLESLKEVLLWSTGTGNVGWDIIAEEEVDRKVGNGHTLVAKLRKPEQWPEKGSLGDTLLNVQEEMARKGFAKLPKSQTL